MDSEAYKRFRDQSSKARRDVRVTYAASGATSWNPRRTSVHTSWGPLPVGPFDEDEPDHEGYAEHFPEGRPPPKVA